MLLFRRLLARLVAPAVDWGRVARAADRFAIQRQAEVAREVEWLLEGLARPKKRP